MSLLDGLSQAIFASALTLALLLALAGLINAANRRRASISLLAGALLGAAVSGIVWATMLRNQPVPLRLYLAGAVVVCLIVTLIWQRGRRLILIPGLALAITGMAGLTNGVYGVYPTVDSLTQPSVSQEMTYDAFLAQQDAPIGEDGSPIGALVDIPLAGPVSGFAARDAVAYVPPAYFTDPQLHLPLIVLMAGNPGSPDDWFSKGYADRTADEYQRTHQGVSPIVVAVDATRTFGGNPICTDGPTDHVMTYLTTDVPTLLSQRFRTTDPDTWTIGGLSYGGTCALQVITNHPGVYGSFLDFSGEAEPTLGDHQQTVNTFFGGNEAAFDNINPATLLTRHADDGTYVGQAGRFIAGQDDRAAVDALTTLHDLAQAAGMDTTYAEVPGGHSFQVWRVALHDTFDWAAARGGLNT